MFGTRRSWATFAGVEAAVVVASIAGAVAGGSFWTPLLSGTVAAFVLSQFRSRRSDVGGRKAETAALDRPPSSDFRASRDAHPGNEERPSSDSALLGTVLETMIEGVMVVDGREQLVYANPAARALLEMSDRIVPGRPLLEAVRSTGIEVAVQTALATGRMHRSELDLPRKERTVALTASPLAGSAASGVVLVLQDVTELRRLERVRREFVSNVSHELKTPLTHIQAYADTLADGAVDDPDNCRKFLDRIIEQAVRLQALIADLLQLARIESQEGTVDLESLELGAEAARSVEEHQAEATAGGVSLSVQCRSEPTVLADAAGLQQIIDNLVANALKYTPAGGSVTVAVYDADGHGVLEVTDTGIGISREDQLRVFERFYRVDRARTRAVGGTGLGLAIVKHLVQLYDGRIELVSELGKGSRFSVRIPLAARIPATS